MLYKIQNLPVIDIKLVGQYSVTHTVFVTEKMLIILPSVSFLELPDF